MFRPGFVGVARRPRGDADQAAAHRRKGLAPRGIESVVPERRPHHAQARAGAVALLLFAQAADLAGGVHLEPVMAQAHEQLPLIVQADLVLHIQATAVHVCMVVAGHRQHAIVLLAAVRVEQVDARHALAAAQQRVTALLAQFEPREQGVLQAEGRHVAFDFHGVEQVARVQVLLPALAPDQAGAGVVAGEVGVVEVAVELEQAQGMAQLPGIVELVVQARAQRLRGVVDVVALRVAIGGAAADIHRATGARIAGDTAVGRAVVAAVFVLHQPVQVRAELPAHRGREQLAAAVDAVAEAVVVAVAHVQAQAEGVAGVGTEVGIQAAQVVAAALGLDAGASAGFGRLAHAVDDTALAAAAVQHRRRPLEHLDPFDVVQVAHVLAVVADAVQVEVVAGVEASDAQAVEAGVGAVADVGDAAQGLAQVMGAVVVHAGGLDRIDGLGHVARRGGGAGGGGHFLDPRVIPVAVGGYRQLGQRGAGSTRQAGAEQGAKPQRHRGKTARDRRGTHRQSYLVMKRVRMVMLCIPKC